MKTLNDNDRKTIDKARRTLKELIGRQRLYGSDYSYGCVKRTDSGFQILWQVQINDQIVTFEECGSIRNPVHRFHKIESAQKEDVNTLGRQLLLHLLNQKAAAVIASHRFGDKAEAALKAAHTLLEEQ